MVQAFYDILNAQGGELNVTSNESEARPADPRLNDKVGQPVGREPNLSFIYNRLNKTT